MVGDVREGTGNLSNVAVQLAPIPTQFLLYLLACSSKTLLSKHEYLLINLSMLNRQNVAQINVFEHSLRKQQVCINLVMFRETVKSLY